MREFFRGGKRKLGVVTLVMACVFTVGWMRSATYSDTISFPLGKRSHAQITSENEYLLFNRYTMDEASSWTSISWRTLLNCDPNDLSLYYRDRSIGCRFLCFEVGAHEENHRRKGDDHGLGAITLFDERRDLFMSYWTMIVPLKLLSAWLLLSRSRPAKRAGSPATNANCGRQNG